MPAQIVDFVINVLAEGSTLDKEKERGWNRCYITWYQELWRACDITCLQAIELACHSFMDAGQRDGTPGSATKDLIPHGKTGSTSFSIVSPGGSCLCSRFASQLRNPSLRKPQSFKGAAGNLLSLCPGGRCYLYYTGQQTSLLSASESASQSL